MAGQPSRPADPAALTLRRCGAELTHTHGVAVCDLAEDHAGSHGSWCDVCLDDGYTDPSDRLDWERDGESWLTA